MKPATIGLLVTNAATIVGLAIQWMRARKDRESVMATTAETLAGAASQLIGPLRDELAAVGEQMANLTREVESLKETSEQLHTAIFAVAPDPMLVIRSGTGEILEANHHAERIFGGASSLIGVHVETLIPERFRAVHRQHRTKFAIAPRIRPMGRGMHLYALDHEGVEHPCEIGLTPYSSDQVIAHIRMLGPAA